LGFFFNLVCFHEGGRCWFVFYKFSQSKRTNLRRLFVESSTREFRPIAATSRRSHRPGMAAAGPDRRAGLKERRGQLFKKTTETTKKSTPPLNADQFRPKCDGKPLEGRLGGVRNLKWGLREKRDIRRSSGERRKRPISLADGIHFKVVTNQKKRGGDDVFAGEVGPKKKNKGKIHLWARHQQSSGDGFFCPKSRGQPTCLPGWTRRGGGLLLGGRGAKKGVVGGDKLDRDPALNWHWKSGGGVGGGGVGGVGNRAKKKPVVVEQKGPSGWRKWALPKIYRARRQAAITKNGAPIHWRIWGQAGRGIGPHTRGVWKGRTTRKGGKGHLNWGRSIYGIPGSGLEVFGSW